MVERVKKWLAAGIEVRIMTARVAPGDARTDPARQRREIAAWCKEHLGTYLPITCQKDYSMIALYDDRCVQVEMNTGRLV